MTAPHGKTFQTPSLIGCEITGIGAFAPETILTNDDLSQLVDTSDEWIQTRTGIKQRHVVSGDQTVAELAIKAAQDALACSGIPGDEIDLVIAASSTPDAIYPGTSCQVQHAIGATHAAGFDMALACTGFMSAMITARQFIQTGAARNAMVVASDIHSRFVDWSDRSTCILFGDAAGAAVLSASDKDSFLSYEMRLDGSKGHELRMGTYLSNCPLVTQRTPAQEVVYLKMNGKEVFKFAVGVVPHSIERALEKAGLKPGDIDHYVLHQANKRIMDAMAERLDVDADRMVMNLDRYGNTSAASIPLALKEASQEGRILPGQKLVLCGFGAGLAWTTAIIDWSVVDQRSASAKQIQKQTAECLEAH
ncbi:MAG: beta-ketoacyl-ACP synthase III [Vampirovibrionales bacterium]|nr:beta-ketoacyl-ACP synthase III [Vampirovibrionales bacterium]